MKRQAKAVEKEAAVQDEQQQQVKQEVVRQTADVRRRVERLRQQTEVLKRTYPELHLPEQR